MTCSNHPVLFLDLVTFYSSRIVRRIPCKMIRIWPSPTTLSWCLCIQRDCSLARFKAKITLPVALTHRVHWKCNMALQFTAFIVLLYFRKRHADIPSNTCAIKVFHIELSVLVSCNFDLISSSRSVNVSNGVHLVLLFILHLRSLHWRGRFDTIWNI